MEEQRWVLNPETGGVFPWSDSFKRRSHLVECNRNGTPIKRIMTRKKIQETLATPDNVEYVMPFEDDGGESVEFVYEDTDAELPDVPLTKQEMKETEGILLIDEDVPSEPVENVLNLGTLMGMTKAEIVEIAKTENVKFTNSDVTKQRKDWFANAVLKKVNSKQDEE